MREIKFRAWVVNDFHPTGKLFSKIDSGSLIAEAFGDRIFSNPDREAPDPIFKQVEFMQYTGLKDKNSVEIYEGDIVKFRTVRLHNKKHTPNEKRRAKWFVSAVEWDDCAFVISETQENDSVLWVDDENKLEVIGNIYENPNLLKGEA